MILINLKYHFKIFIVLLWTVGFSGIGGHLAKYRVRLVEDYLSNVKLLLVCGLKILQILVSAVYN